MEFESFNAGTLLYIGLEEGVSASVDSIIAIIGEPNEDISALISGGNTQKVAEAAPQAAATTTETKTEVAPAAAQVPADVKIIRVPCSCRVNPMFILRAFQRGADGVIMCGCHPGDCHYTTGNYYARRRMTLLFSMLDYLGIEKGRTRVEWVSAAEGQKFAETMNSFVETIYQLGENKRLEDLRCKNK